MKIKSKVTARMASYGYAPTPILPISLTLQLRKQNKKKLRVETLESRKGKPCLVAAASAVRP
jgi:hypothetical protein